MPKHKGWHPDNWTGLMDCIGSDYILAIRTRIRIGLNLDSNFFGDWIKNYNTVLTSAGAKLCLNVGLPE